MKFARFERSPSACHESVLRTDLPFPCSGRSSLVRITYFKAGGERRGGLYGAIAIALSASEPAVRSLLHGGFGTLHNGDVVAAHVFTDLKFADEGEHLIIGLLGFVEVLL